MKKSLLLVGLLLIINQGFTQEEVKTLIKTAEKDLIKPDRHYWLVDYRGEIKGSYQTFIETSPAKLEVFYNNEKVVIENPLSFITVNSDVDRIYLSGDKNLVESFYTMNLHIYDGKGKLINKVDNIGHTPFAVCISSQGDVYIASNEDFSESKPNYQLRKYDKNGIFQWKYAVQRLIPHEISISNNGKYIALFGIDRINKDKSIFYFNDNGEMIRLHEHIPTITFFDFLNNMNIVIGIANEWKIYSSPSEYSIVSEGIIEGVPAGGKPITSSEHGDWFSITTLTYDTFCILSAFETHTGKLLNVGLYKGNIYWEDYRFAEINKDETIDFILDNKILNLKLEK